MKILLNRFVRLPASWQVRWAAPLAALILLIALQLITPAWADQMEGWLTDLRFRIRGAEPPKNPIVIVALDESSFQSMGELRGENIRTWPRRRWAELIEKIAIGKPRLIALDVVLDTPGWDTGGDQALAEALARSGNVILASNLETSKTDAGAFLTYSPPLDILKTAAAGTGVAVLSPDADGTIRNATLVWNWNNSQVPSLALVVANLYAGSPPNVPRRDLGKTLSLPIRYRGPESTFQTISLVDVWEGRTDPNLFQGAIVLVGYTTQVEQDRHQTPFGAKAPGVEIQANVTDMLLAGD